MKNANIPFDKKKSWLIPGALVGQRKPNNWGLYDMLGNLVELTLDRIPLVSPDGQQRRDGSTVSGLVYSDAKDPLAWDDGEEPVSVMRSYWGMHDSGPGWAGRKICQLWRGYPAAAGFRIVAGPDLVKERNLKSRAK